MLPSSAQPSQLEARISPLTSLLLPSLPLSLSYFVHEPDQQLMTSSPSSKERGTDWSTVSRLGETWLEGNEVGRRGREGGGGGERELRTDGVWVRDCVRCRFPHALVMALLFHKGDWKAKAVSLTGLSVVSRRGAGKRNPNRWLTLSSLSILSSLPLALSLVLRFLPSLGATSRESRPSSSKQPKPTLST